MNALSAQKASSGQMIETLIFNDASQAANQVAALLRDHIRQNPAPVLGLATGRTMQPVYARLRAWFSEGTISFRNCTSFNLDEYCDLPEDSPASFASYMRRELFDHVDLPAKGAHLPDPDIARIAPATYDDLIKQAGGIGLQLLGIGRNGHIGFNEPGADGQGRTHVVTLDASTRAANAADFPAGTEVPHRAVTMGIGSILEARHIVLLATGEAKAQALAQALHGPISAECPASYLQLHHTVTVVCDQPAAALLGELS